MRPSADAAFDLLNRAFCSACSIVAENRGPLEDVAQLANVAGPVIVEQQPARITRDAGRRPPEAAAVFVEERLTQRQHVLFALAQRRQLDREHVEPVEQVLAELAAAHRQLQIPVRRGDDARVGAQHTRPAEPLELPLLQHAQEFRLHRQAHLADFVEEQRAAAGLLELTGLALRRARKRAALVPEQLRLEQLLRQRRAVEGDERAVPARRGAVHKARGDFLPGPRFAEQQHRRIGRRHLRRLREHAAPRRRLADDASIAGARVELLGQRTDP